MSNNNQPYGVDVSSYQGQIDFNKLLPKIKFLAARATISWGYQDKWFERNRILSGDLPFFAYHVLYPGENADAQMDNLLRAAPFDGKIRYCIDSELAHGNTKLVITNAIRNVSERLKAETGHYPIQYSRASWLDQYVNIYDLPDMDWWLAHYLNNVPGNPYTPEHPGPPALPKGVSTWLIHQTGSHGNGLEHGVPASANQFIDQNRWNGTEADLLAYFGLGEEVPEPVEPPVEVPLFRARVTATANLRVRSGPGTGYPVSAPSLPYRTVVEVYEISNGWYRHNKGGWSDSTWLERVDETPAPPDPPVIVNTPYYGALYWQRDPRWVAEPLGTSGTIGAYGCTMCCETNALNQLGIVTNPMINNKWRTENGGYHNGNLMVWEKVSLQHPEIEWEGRTWNPTDAMMLAKIASGSVLVILVDHNENTPELNEHWVVSVPRNDGQLWIYDPWDGQLVRFRDRYKKPVQQFTSYRRQA